MVQPVLKGAVESNGGRRYGQVLPNGYAEPEIGPTAIVPGSFNLCRERGV